MLCEYLLLSWMFDAAPLQRRIAWVSDLGYVVPLAVAIGTAILVFVSTRSRSAVGRIPAAALTVRRASPYVALHAVLFLAFLLLTRALFSRGRVISGAPEAWFVGWALLALGVIGALALAVASPRQLWSLLRQARLSILLGVLVGIAAWIAGRAAERLWRPLGGITVRAAAQVLSWIFTDTVSDPSRLMVGTSHFRVVVAPVCSGFEGMGLMTVLLAFWLVAFRRELRFPNALLLVPLGVSIAWTANVFRIVALIAIGSRWSRALALGGFHSKAGWVFFCAAAFALILVARRARFFTRATSTPEEDTWNPTAAYLVPLLSALAVQLVGGLFSVGPHFLYPTQGLIILAALWAYRKGYGFRSLSWSWMAVLIGAFAFVVYLVFERLLPRSTPIFDPRLQLGAPSIATSAVLLATVSRSVIVLPLAEELAFRGYLLRRLISENFIEVSPRKFAFNSFLISSVAFGALQGSWIAGTIAGMLYALAQYRRGQLGDAFLAHAVTSLLAAAYAYRFVLLP